MRKTTRTFISLCILLIASQNVSSAQPVVLQLKWDHEFQFAGFYAAKHLGYYDDVGLDVEIRSRVNEDNSLKDVFTELSSGRAQFALSGPDLIIAAETYPSLRIAATLMQESPMVFVAREGEFVSPAEFVGKRIVNAEPHWGPVEIHALMQAVGSRQTTLQAENLPPDLTLLTSGQVDLVMTYAPSAYWQAQEVGQTFDYFSARQYGVHFYGDTLIVDASFAEKNPDLTKKFIAASLRGWEYAMNHQDEISELIATKYKRRFDWYEDFAAYNRFEANFMSDLMLYPTVEIGHSSKERWQRTIKYFYDAGFIKSELNASDLLLDLHTKSVSVNTYWYFVAILSMVTIGLVGGLFALFWVRMLRAKVQEKTSELAALNSNLEHLVDARTQELAAEKDRAEEASKAKDKLVANVSHELRTPMNAIIGFSELAMRDKSINDERGYFLRINASAKSLLSIINDLLDFSKMDADKLELDLIQFNLHELLKHCAEVFTFGANEKGLQYSFTLGPQIPRLVTGDPARLQQILTNVIGNAIKFTPLGHVNVMVNLLSVDASDEKNGESQSRRCRINFIVEDSGIGIDPSQIEKMFQPFSQADASITRMFGGTGLGLTITRYLVNLMRGTIAVISEKGQGARFEVTIPFMVSASEVSQASRDGIGDVTGRLETRPSAVARKEQNTASDSSVSDTAESTPWCGKLALLVEDNDFNAEVARGFIEYQGVALERVADGPSALETLAMRRAVGAPDFDMIFMPMGILLFMLILMAINPSLVTPHIN
ncbi:MAG: ABC transporter substrate-binding protein [Hahellaceae bacterium]|nr:ABC transporter substrate-binding protein [Hahellaceae bacterium]MCP5210678.1 ABC transporter substrate-binding protein [Hahellaceae bacterium]